MYLQVFHLIDMIELNGRLFKTEYITGKKLLKPKSSYRWMNQPNPSPRA